MVRNTCIFDWCYSLQTGETFFFLLTELRTLILQTLKSTISDGRGSRGSTDDTSDQQLVCVQCGFCSIMRITVFNNFFLIVQVRRVVSALVLTNTAYIEAKAASTPSTMTMSLVKSSFSQRRLRRSTYAGQKRKDEQKPSLKRYQKMQDIQGMKLLFIQW